jgi:Reverse transcriptase (RNA-dependent DNA polymerase)
MGYTRSEIDACVYAKTAGSKIQIVAVYVDDLLICGQSEESVDRIADKLAESFTMTDIGVPDEMIGWNISRVNDSIVVTQEKYIRRLQKKYSAFLIKTKSPSTTGALLHPAAKEEKRTSTEEYRSLMGSCQYLATGVRLESTFLIKVLSRYVNNPTKRRLKIAIKLLSYICSTPELGIVYKNKERKGRDKLEIEIYCDADMGGPEVNNFTIDNGSRINCHSTSGYIITIDGMIVIF